jgi:hypothetical protein
MSIGKRLTALLLSVSLICALGIGANALHRSDLSRTGEITMVMKDGDTAVPGGTVEVFQVGEAVLASGGEFDYVLTDDFRKSGVSLDDVESATAAQTLADYAEENLLTGTIHQISKDGKVTFSDLEAGVYLVVQEVGNEAYALVNPFLVELPQNLNGTYQYQVTATPKLTAASDDDGKPTDTEINNGDPEPTASPKPTESPTPTTSGTPIDEEGDNPPTAEPSNNPETTPPVTSESPTPTTTPATATPSTTTPGTNTATPTTTTTTTTTTEKLPQTGQLRWPIPVLVMVGVVLIACGIRLRREDREDQ